MPHSDNSFDPIIILHQCGLRATPSRLAVVNWLARQKNPTSIAAIKRGLGREAPNQATLYRMMSEFARHGLVRRIDLAETKAYFEIFDPHDHHHVICLKCQTIEDVVLGGNQRLTHQALKQAKKFRQINYHSLEFWGVCRECSK